MFSPTTRAMPRYRRPRSSPAALSARMLQLKNANGEGSWYSRLIRKIGMAYQARDLRGLQQLFHPLHSAGRDQVRSVPGQIPSFPERRRWHERWGPAFPVGDCAPKQQQGVTVPSLLDAAAGGPLQNSRSHSVWPDTRTTRTSVRPSSTARQRYESHPFEHRHTAGQATMTDDALPGDHQVPASNPVCAITHHQPNLTEAENLAG